MLTRRERKVEYEKLERMNGKNMKRARDTVGTMSREKDKELEKENKIKKEKHGSMECGER